MAKSSISSRMLSLIAPLVVVVVASMKVEAFSTPHQHRQSQHRQQQQHGRSFLHQRTLLQSSSTPPPATPRQPLQITTPIYYVNDKPHIGHAYTSIACDVLARYHRLSSPSTPVFLLSGTDEHGQKVQASAEAAGVPPQQFCDDVSKKFRELLGVLECHVDHFVRTTDRQHVDAVQHFWKVLDQNGHVYLGSYEGWYSVRDECYYNESELVDGLAPTGAEVKWVTKEESYFFRLSDFQDRLLQFYDDNPTFILPLSRRNEVVNFVKSGLRDLSISRTSFTWGIPVPSAPDHVMYVWIDALTNYISALGYPPSQQEDANDGDSAFDTYWPNTIHIVGKDILRFHAVYWPALLMAAGLPLPRRLFAHGWWTNEGEKISKSLGNTVDPLDLVDRFGTDRTRFFLTAGVTFGSDGDYSETSLIRRANSNLSNELGNLVQRVVALSYANCDGATPDAVDVHEDYTAEDLALLQDAKNLQAITNGHIDNQALHLYAEAIILIVRSANRYIDVMAPWSLAKVDTHRMKVVLYVLLEVLRRVAILYQPIIPNGAAAILDQLGVPMAERDFDWLETGSVRMGAQLEKPEPVFPRIELPGEAEDRAAKQKQKQDQKQKAKQKQKQKQNKKQQQAPPRTIDISALDIRVGLITEAKLHPDADRLYIEQIDLGEGEQPRIVASGLREHYPDPENLVGRRVLVMTNLKARKLVGVESYGMVLCASANDGRVELVEPPEGSAVGERVTFEGYDAEPATENQVIKKKMLDVICPDLKTDDDGVATYKGIPFNTSAGVCRSPSGMKGASVS